MVSASGLAVNVVANVVTLTVQLWLAGVRSGKPPALSVATLKVWLPLLRSLTGHGLLQGTAGASSSWHSKATAVALPVKVKLAPVLFTMLPAVGARLVVPTAVTAAADTSAAATTLAAAVALAVVQRP